MPFVMYFGRCQRWWWRLTSTPRRSAPTPRATRSLSQPAGRYGSMRRPWNIARSTRWTTARCSERRRTRRCPSPAASGSTSSSGCAHARGGFLFIGGGFTYLRETTFVGSSVSSSTVVCECAYLQGGHRGGLAVCGQRGGSDAVEACARCACARCARALRVVSSYLCKPLVGHQSGTMSPVRCP